MRLKLKRKGKSNMPMGKGTYGKLVGRPSKKMGAMSKAKNQKPMAEVKNGNGTKGKLTAAQKTLPDFLKKKIKATRKTAVKKKR